MLEHGGRLREAAQRYGIAMEDWIDLSTALNPDGYVPPWIPAAAWLRLPEANDGLELAAATYYRNVRLLPVPGSQAALQALPKIFPQQRVGVLAPGYNEHAHAWRSAGHDVIDFAADQLEAVAARCDTLVLCNPNNPDAHRIAPQRLLSLAQTGKRLLVDEAFVDTTLELSLTPFAGSRSVPHLIVLRSMGKFFGLAGARLGFVFADPVLLATLAELIGPWAVSGPARIVATAALRDTEWQRDTRHRLIVQSQRLLALLAPAFSSTSTPTIAAAHSTSLFVYVRCNDASAHADFFARRGILVRHFDNALRFGLPAGESAWQRLAAAIDEWNTK